ncbi:MAG: glycoside hydrolase family 88 protein, partial [Ignavibacteria bacterium]|nr:glycoside hydrolase family 88 protein [Ignavibacteria bacterium]
PFYAKYASLFDERESFDDIFNQFSFIERHTRDSSSGLFFHAWNETKDQRWADTLTGTSPNFWGRAIGWYCMALVDVLDYFPEDHPKRNSLIFILKNLSESLMRYRDSKTKLWYQVVDKGNREGNYFEASGSLMFTYAFAKGANKGYLDKKYLAFAKESFNGAVENLVTVDDKGILYLNNVCAGAGLGGKPYRDGSYDYYINEKIRTNDFKGYGSFILSAIELEKSVSNNATIKVNQPEFTVGLDYFFNNEYKNVKRFHYTWEDETNSGFSELGKLIKKLGGNISSLETAPTAKTLGNFSIYIIVDPDIQTENPNPKYIDEYSRNEIVSWVKDGGILLILANDSLNCEFDNLNLLSEKFGIHFNGNSKNRVVGKNFDLGKIDKFPMQAVFNNVNSIYLKEISTLSVSSKANCILKQNENCIMASSEYGKGFVFAVGDPWFYNEYFDNRKLPTGFENSKAAENLFIWLKSKFNLK